jgi:hypothetical protein
MSLINWRRRLDRIDEVFVPESALADGTHPRDLPMYISYLVRHALGQGMYLRDELPREALIASALLEYLSEVDNEGHAQFVGNKGWAEEHRGDIRDGLAILGLDEAARIFADLEAFAVRAPKHLAHNGANTHEHDPYFKELDRRLCGPVAKSIDVAFRAWLKARPWLRTMPDEDYFRIPGWEPPNHTLREARLEERRQSIANVAGRKLLYLRATIHSRKENWWRRVFWRLVRAWYSRG